MAEPIVIENEIDMRVDLEKAYALISGKNEGSIGFLSEDWPGLEIKDIEDQSYKWDYSALKLKFSGTGTFNPKPEDLSVVSENRGSFNSMIVWKLERSAVGTLLKFRIEYDPSMMIRVSKGLHEKRIAQLLQNIKKRLEE